MSETNWVRATAVCAVVGVFTLFFTLWGLLLVGVALGAYVKRTQQHETHVASETAQLLAAATTTPHAVAVQSGPMQLQSLLHDAGLDSAPHG